MLRPPKRGAAESDATSRLNVLCLMADVAPASLLFVSGSGSGVGKSHVSLTLLMSLLESGVFRADELAYIKPCTQCESVQLISKYCAARAIACVGRGPVLYRPGFTYDAIKGGATHVQQLHEAIRERVAALSKGKKFVLIDGVGYPSVGSVSGTSNADVARLLGAPVLFVAPPGVGDAIDSFNLALAFFQKHNVAVLGAVFNKLPMEPEARHSFSNCVKYVSAYVRQSLPEQHIYGFLPRLDALQSSTSQEKTCAISNSPEALKLSDDELERLNVIRTQLVPKLDCQQMLADIAKTKTILH